jgi:hypothetical protein
VIGALTVGGNAHARQHGAAEQAEEPVAAEPVEAGDQSEEVAPQGGGYGEMDSDVGSYQSAHGDAGYESCDEPCYDSCGGDGGMWGALNRPISLIFGAEFIYARASFSEALAYVNQDLIAGGEDFVELDFDFNPSYSFYGGVAFPDCGGAILFDFTRMTSDADFAAAETVDTNVFGPYEIDSNIRGSASVDRKTYDLSFAKTIPLGCALACPKACGDCCDKCTDDSCCDSCCDKGCGWCPAWDIVWSGGIRYGDVDWGRTVTAFDPLNNNAFIDSATGRMDFNGFGGRVGLLGRRYFGRRGLFSAYAKGDWSLLFGEMETDVFITNNAGTAFIHNEGDRIVPVTNIELGLTAHIGARGSLSAGYFWEAWHDLGMRDEYDFNQFELSHYDDANILGFDGLFARAEVTF